MEETNMGKIRRKFDESFKIQVCQQVEAGIQTVAQICRDNQIQRPVVDGWLRRHAEGTLITNSKNRERELERENEKLRAKVGELTMTIDILKKMEEFAKRKKNESSLIFTSKNLPLSPALARPLELPLPATTISQKLTRQRRT